MKTNFIINDGKWVIWKRNVRVVLYSMPSRVPARKIPEKEGFSCNIVFTVRMSFSESAISIFVYDGFVYV